MNWNRLLLRSALVGVVLVAGIAGPAAACPNCWNHGTSWTNEDQAKVDEIRQTYDEELNTLETRLRSVSRDLGRAVTAQEATRATELRQQLADLERAYDATQADLGENLREAGLAGYRGRGAWNCRWHDDHRSRGKGYQFARNGGHGRRGGCCW